MFYRFVYRKNIKKFVESTSYIESRLENKVEIVYFQNHRNKVYRLCNLPHDGIKIVEKESI